LQDSRVINSVRNIGYRLSSQVITILLRFVERSIFIHVLGVEYLGINGLFSQILQVLSMADLGFGTAMVYSMYKPLAEKDETKLAQLVQFYKKVYTVIAVSITILGVALVPFLQYIVNLKSDIPYLRVYYLLYLANTVASYLVVYKTCILTADQKNYVVSKYNMIFSFVMTVVGSFFLWITRRFIVYLSIQVLITYINNFTVSKVAEKNYPYILNKTEKLPKTESKAIFENIKSVFIYKLATTLVGSVDNTLISIIVGTIYVGYYSNYSMVIGNISLIVNMIFSSVTASLGNLIVEGNENKNYSVYKTMQFISFVFSTIVITGTYLLINDFIAIWLGPAYNLDNLVVVAMVINLYFSIVLMPIWSYREATGMYRQTKYVMVATAVVNLVVSLILAQYIGMAGILFASSIARITTYFWYEPKILFAQYFKKKATSYYSNIAINVIITLVVLKISISMFGNYDVNSWIDFIQKFSLSVMVVPLITIALYSWNKEMRKVISIVKTIFKQR